MKLFALLGILILPLWPLRAVNAADTKAYPGQSLTQVSFDRLIPRSYPMLSVRFNALRPTTDPIIRVGVARVPITEKLVRTDLQPLLRPY